MKSILKMLVLFAILLAVEASRSIAVAQDREEVKIGLIYPLTGSMSTFGDDMARALPVLEKRFNSTQSKYKYSLILEDGKFGQGNAAISAAKKLVDVDKAKFLVVGSSGEVLQVAPFAESAHVLVVAGFASHPDIKKAGDYIFRTYIDIERDVQLVIKDILAKHIERVAIVTELSSFTSAVRETLRKGLSDKVIFSEDFTAGDADLKTTIAKARSKNPQVYYLNTTAPASFINLFKALRETGVTEQFYTYYVPTIKEVQESLGSKLEGTLYLDFPEDGEMSSDFREFLFEFERETGRPPSALFNFKTNYNAIKVIVDAIDAVGPNPTKAKDFLYRYDRLSATGRMRFDENGDALNLNLKLRTFEAPAISN